MMHDQLRSLAEWQPPIQLSAPLWIYGLSPTGQQVLGQAVQQMLESPGGQVLVIPAAWTGYQSYASLSGLIEAFWPIVTQEAPELVEHFRPRVAEVLPHVFGRAEEPRSRRSPADAIVFSVIRRISRESHHSALVVDALARFLLAAKRACPSLRQPLTLVVPGLEYWDRPSVRVLYRLHCLSTPADQLHWIALLGSQPRIEQGIDPPLPARLARARARFLKTVQAGGGARQFYLQETAPFALPPPPPEGWGEASIKAVAEALTDQNYERVYLLCQTLLEQGTEPEDLSHTWRLIALADANVTAYEDSVEALERAFHLSSTPTFRAHLRYLQGLLTTKRFYDLNIAEDFYLQGEAELAGCDQDESDVKLEKAWLLNGRALVRSLQAKEVQGEQRETLLRESFRMETQAYKLVAKGRGPAFSYLRYNLLANITFLLEISQQFDEAVDFWRRAFEPHMAIGNPGFELAFNGRLGLLQSRGGHLEEAVQLLGEAYRKAEELADPYYQERLGYCLAYAWYRAGRLDEASALFCEGLRLAAEQRLWRNFAEQLAGAIYCAARLQDEEAFKSLLQLGAQLSAHPLCAPCKALLERTRTPCPSPEELQHAGIRLPAPSPKLPAYIADIDLEGLPEHDLNRLLTDAEPQRLVPLRQRSVAASGGA